MNARRGLSSMRNILILGVGVGLNALLGFVLQILLARSVTSATLGNFSAAFLLVTMLSPLCGFGIPQYFLKIFGQHGVQGARWVPPALRFIFYSTVCTFAGVLVIGMVSYETATLRFAASLLALVMLGNLATEVVSSVLQLEEKYVQLSGWQMLQTLLRCLGLVAAVMWAGRPLDVIVVAAIYGGVALLLAWLGWARVKQFRARQLRALSEREAGAGAAPLAASMGTIFKEASPFGLFAVSYLVYNQFAIIVVRHLVDPDSAGYYSITFTIMNATLLLPGLVYQKYLLPKLHRWAYHDPRRLYLTFVRGNYIMGLTGLLVTVIIWFLAPVVIPVVFGSQYTPAVDLTKWIALGIPMTYMAASAEAPLVTGENMLYKVKIMAAVAVLNIGLNLLLIPLYGLKAAIATTLLCNALLLVLYMVASYRLVFNHAGYRRA